VLRDEGGLNDHAIRFGENVAGGGRAAGVALRLAQPFVTRSPGATQ
jgi:hypothetical protein